MGSDLVSIFGSAALATINPTLLAAVAVMLLLPHPSRLMLGYLVGAYTTSLAVGLAVILSVHSSGVLTTSRHTVGPGGDVLIGTLVVVVALVLATDRDVPLRNWRAQRKARKAAGEEEPRQSWHMRLLGRGSPRITFLVGAALSLPGVTYLNTLHHIVEMKGGLILSILLVLFFCVMQQLLIEIPLVGYLTAPDWTPQAVTRFRAWLQRRGRSIATYGFGMLGTLLMLRGAITLAG
jgi:Sap, sulfolipid-1-addressing protein